jgi:hypothetical protein
MAEACYREPYLPASYKLVPFKAISVESQHGRRGAEGEFPFGENTAYADLGRKLRRYTIRARFDSNNHVLEAAALIAAVEFPGPGVLVHPTRGVIASAACVSLKVSDRIEDEGGVTYVDMEFVEANNWPNGLSLVSQLLGLAISPIIATSRTNFSATYAPTNAQPFRKEAVINAAQDQIVAIASAYAEVTATVADQTARNRILYDLEMLANDDIMASDTQIMDKGIALGMNAVALNISGQRQFEVFRALANGAAKTSTFLNPAKSMEDVVYSNVRIIAAAYMAQGAFEAQDVRLDTIFEYLDVIDTLLSQEISIARENCNNCLFLELTKFRNDVATQLHRKAYNAPTLIQYNFNGPVHPLVAAYSIYADGKKHRQLEVFNLIANNGRIGPQVAAAIGGI